MNGKYDWERIATLGVSCIIRNDFSDFDYIEKLNKEELNFLKGFNREYYNADFKHKNKKHFKKPKDIKICNDLNNARNRDIYAKTKILQKLDTIDSRYDIRNLFYSETDIGNLFLYNSKGEIE